MSDISQIALNGVTYDVKDTNARNVASEKVDTNGGDISLTKITAENITTEFPVPASGDTAKRFLGKMKKFCEDLNSFKSGIITLGKIVNNGLCNQEGFVLDARQANPNIENTMAWKINKQNSDFTSTKNEILQMANDNYRLVTKFGNSNITSNADGSFQLTHGLGAPCVVIARFGGTNQGYITFGGDIGENSAYGVVRDTNGKGFAFTGGIFWVAIGFVHR